MAIVSHLSLETLETEFPNPKTNERVITTTIFSKIAADFTHLKGRQPSAPLLDLTWTAEIVSPESALSNKGGAKRCFRTKAGLNALPKYLSTNQRSSKPHLMILLTFKKSCKNYTNVNTWAHTATNHNKQVVCSYSHTRHLNNKLFNYFNSMDSLLVILN